MALKELIARLERDAQARADAASDKARAEAAGIDRQAALESSQERAAVLAARRQERRARLEQELSNVKARLRANELTARQKVIDRVFERAREQSSGLSGLTPERLAQALPYFGDVRARARCRADSAPLLAAAGVEVRVDEGAPAAVVLEAVDGSCEIDLGLPARLERERARLSLALLKELVP